MRRRSAFTAVVTGLTLVSVIASGAGAKSPTTFHRTIRDLDEDNLLEYAPGEAHIVLGADDGFRPPKNGSILNFLQLSDFQIVDEESPTRVEFLDFNQRGPRDSTNPTKAAYRPQESLTNHVTESMVRAVRGMRSPVTGRPLRLAILTGDNADSQQYNETRWFIDILDGGKKIDPNSGIPTDACPAQDDSVYDGVRGDGAPFGYYEPDSSDPGEDGDGYSPDRDANASAPGGKDVTVRDFPGLLEAANRPFRSRGLKIPWYSAFGNHDALVQGNSPEAFVGPYGSSGETVNPSFHAIAAGCVKPTTMPNPADPTDLIGNLSEGENVPPDPRRCFVAKDEAPAGSPEPCDTGGWIEQHFLTAGKPVGHGFVMSQDLDTAAQEAGYGRPEIADANNDGYYSFSPTRGIRFVVLDTITDECGIVVCAEGSLDDPQFVWLEDQIAKAEEMGQYVLVFAHHTLRTTRFPSTDPSEQPVHYGQRFDRDTPYNPQNSGPVTLEELFCQHPAVIAHVAGHEHENYIRHYTCEEDSPPTLLGDGDFWQIVAAGHIDWPQQGRMIELIDNGDGKTMSIVTTVLDHVAPPRPEDAQPLDLLSASGNRLLIKLASIARELSYNDYQIERHPGPPEESSYRKALGEDPEDRNVIIVLDRPWPYAAP